MADRREVKQALDTERYDLLGEIEGWLEGPMIVLGFGWLAILIVQLVHGVSPVVRDIGDAIWILFIADFLLRLLLAPDKLTFLRNNWITALSLLLPALRVLRIVTLLPMLSAALSPGGIQLVAIVGSVNRGMRALRRTMGRRGIGFVAALTLIIALVGAAGMYAFEASARGGPGFKSYGDALYWTVMLMTTIGSAYWPVTGEGRVLCILLSMYSISVFGYITAALASFFVDRDAASPDSDVAGADDMATLLKEIQSLHEEVRALREGGIAGSS